MTGILQLLLGQSSAAPAYQIQRSLRFNSADSAYLNRTPSSTTNRKTWTFSCWAKLCHIPTGVGEWYSIFSAGDYSSASASYTFQVTTDGGVRSAFFTNSSYDGYFFTSNVQRDLSAWYHFVVSIDTTQATASNRVKMYANNLLLTGSAVSDVAQNYDTGVNLNQQHFIGAFKNSSPAAFGRQYLTEINFIDGQALTPSSFGETNANTGVWQPKAYTGTYGTNGFYVNFSDNSNTTSTTLGKDYSGNSNNWTPNNFSVTAGAGNDSLVDSPTNYGTDTGVGGEVRGNYATMNPLQTSSTYVTFANGNLTATDTTTPGSFRSAYSTIFANSGKYYFESLVTTIVTPAFGTIGVASPPPQFDMYIEQTLTGYQGYLYAADGTKATNDTYTAFGNSFTSGDIISVALDIDSGKVWFAKNGVWQASGDPATGANPAFNIVTGRSYGFAVGNGSSVSSVQHDCNFGQRPWAYTAPSGFKALCTQNLPTPTIGATSATQAGKYFNTVLYTGNGSTQTVSGVGFQPDLVWNKQRSSSVGSNWLNDAVRTAGYSLSSNRTDAEADFRSYFTAFNSDGFGLAGGTDGFNANAATYVAWNWKANGAGSSNTQGTITSTVSANTTAGFSIVTYTGNATQGATVGHGLGVTPAMLIVKSRSLATDWVVQHKSAGTAPSKLILNSTAAVTNSAPEWNNAGGTPTAFNSTVFTIGASGYSVNNSGETYLAYVFAEVAGYSAFGSYTGNGSTDGPFVYTGFRPRYVMIKCSSSSLTNNADWRIMDSARNQYNVMDKMLYANLSAAEDSVVIVDFLSNGFKLRQTVYSNNSGETYIYAAFAEFPFKYTLAR